MAMALLVAAAAGLLPSAPKSYVPESSYIRMLRSSQGVELQTAAVSLEIRDDRASPPRSCTLELLSTVHVAEPEYYDGLLREKCEEKDRVLFELIASESSVSVDEQGAKRLVAPLEATPQLRELAASHRLVAQADALSSASCGPRWVLADESAASVESKARELGEGSVYGTAIGRTAFASLASPARTLVSGPLRRGSALRPLACLLPAPEACLLLDDWIASGGAAPSPVLNALVGCACRLELDLARRLSFATTLAAGETSQRGEVSGALVRWRNARALEAVDAALAAGCERVALLYGALHMRDLRARLQDRFTLTYVGRTEWRTAWAIRLPVGVESFRIGGGGGPAGGPDGGPAGGPDGGPDGGSAGPGVPAFALLAAVLAAVDGSDWIRTILTLTGGGDASLLPNDRILDGVLYIGRHALLYLALQRWAFDFESRWWAVDADLPAEAAAQAPGGS